MAQVKLTNKYKHLANKFIVRANGKVKCPYCPYVRPSGHKTRQVEHLLGNVFRAQKGQKKSDTRACTSAQARALAREVLDEMRDDPGHGNADDGVDHMVA